MPTTPAKKPAAKKAPTKKAAAAKATGLEAARRARAQGADRANGPAVDETPKRAAEPHQAKAARRQAGAIARHRAELDKATAQVARETSGFLAAYRDLFTYEELAELLGLSRPRIAQLIAELKRDETPGPAAQPADVGDTAPTDLRAGQ